MTLMNRVALAAVVTLTAALAAIPTVPAMAQAASVTFEYVPPKNPKFEPLRQRLMDRRVLEELTEFVSPLQMKRDLLLTTVQCNAVNAFYSPREQTLKMCYEFVDDLHKTMIPFLDGGLKLSNGEIIRPTITGVTRGEAIVGTFVGVIMHELGHAANDIQEIPVLGKEEDAADQFSAFLLVQFGPDVARTTIKGIAAYWDLSAQTWDWGIRTGKAPHHYYPDSHSLSAQRMYNFLCVAYGRHPDAFKDLVDQGLLPRARAQNCAKEYKQIEHAFLKTVMPAIDRKKMDDVRGKTWLRPGDLM
jgi:hypothetical protein